MIQYQLKLLLTSKQEKTLASWLPILGGVWNFAIRKIELNAKDKIYFTKHEFQNILAGHSNKVSVPSHTIQGMLINAHLSWGRCFKGLAKKPRLKGFRRPCNYIPLPDPIKSPNNGRVYIPEIGKVRFHKQWLPEGKIKYGRICRRTSGWYLCLFIDAEPKAVPRTGNETVGIDPGFNDLLTLSTGEKIRHPKEFRTAERRLGQAQRGHRKRLAARLHERIKNRRRDRNHKLSRRLVSENRIICFLKDNHRAVARRFGKSVGDSAHGGLRMMLGYKCLAGGTKLVFPENRNSTRTCSTCGALTGPTGLAGLRVREWDCGACGAHHERDCNSAQNALNSGVGLTLEVANAYA